MTHRGRSARAIPVRCLDAPPPPPLYRSLRSLARRNPAKTDRRSESPLFPSTAIPRPHPDPRTTRRGIPNGAVFPTQALVHSRIHPPPGPGPPGPPSPSPRVSPRTSLRHRSPSTSPRRRTRSRRLRPATRSDPSSRRETTKDAAAAARAGPRRSPGRSRPPASRTLPAIPNGRQPVPGLRSVPAPDPVLVPAPDPAPHPLPRPGSRPHIPVPDVAMGSRRRRDPARGVASIRRARDSSTLPRRGPHEHGCLLLHEPRGAMQSARAARAIVWRIGSSARTRSSRRNAPRASSSSQPWRRRGSNFSCSGGRNDARSARFATACARSRTARANETEAQERLLSVDAVAPPPLSDGETTFTALCALAFAPASTPRSVSTERPRQHPGSETARHGSSARRPRRGSKDVLAHHRDVDGGGRRGSRRAAARRGDGAGSD